MRRKSAQQGFTLIEVLIVVAMLAIIVGIGLPSYLESAKQSRRSDAMTELVQIMQQQERFFVNNSTYTIDLTDLGYASSNATSEKGYYVIGAAACGGDIQRCVLLTATPQNKQAGDGNITLSSRGVKSATGDALAADVWG